METIELPDNSTLSPFYSLLMTSVMTSINTITIIACGVTFGIVYVLKKRNVWNATLYCILNIAIADVIFIGASAIQSDFHAMGATSDTSHTFCIVTGIFKKIALATSTYFVVMYAFATLLSELLTTTADLNTCLKHSRFFIVVVWFLTACVTTTQVGLSQENELYPIEQCKMRRTNNTADDFDAEASALSDLLLYFVIPFILMVGTYVIAALGSWARYALMVDQERRKENKQMFNKLVLMIIIRVVGFSLLWLPYHGSYYYISVANEDNFLGADDFITFDRVARWLSYTGVAFNRFLYGFNCLDFGVYYKKLSVLNRRPNNRSQSNQNSSQNSIAERRVTSQGSASTVEQTNQSNVSVTVDDEAPLVANEQPQETENVAQQRENIA